MSLSRLAVVKEAVGRDVGEQRRVEPVGEQLRASRGQTRALTTEKNHRRIAEDEVTQIEEIQLCRRRGAARLAEVGEGREGLRERGRLSELLHSEPQVVSSDLRWGRGAGGGRTAGTVVGVFETGASVSAGETRRCAQRCSCGLVAPRARGWVP